MIPTEPGINDEGGVPYSLTSRRQFGLAIWAHFVSDIYLFISISTPDLPRSSKCQWNCAAPVRNGRRRTSVFACALTRGYFVSSRGRANQVPAPLVTCHIVTSNGTVGVCFILHGSRQRQPEAVGIALPRSPPKDSHFPPRDGQHLDAYPSVIYVLR